MSRRLLYPLLLAPLLALLCQPLAAEEKLGAPQVFDAAALRLEIDSADIEVRVERQRQPQIRSSRPLALEDLGGELHFRLETPVRPGGRTRIELFVRRGQSLHVAGADLVLDVVDPLLPGEEPPEERVDAEDDEAVRDGVEAEAEGDEEDDEDEAPSWLDGYGVLRLRLTDSAVTLRGLKNLDLELDACQSLLYATGGPLLGTVNGGTIESEEHAGDLDLLVTDAEARFTSLDGHAKVDQLAGALSLVGGRGQSWLKVSEGSVRVEARDGIVGLDGERGYVELLRHTRGIVTLQGSAHQVRLEEPNTAVRVQLDGGRLDVDGGNQSILFKDASRLDVEVDGFGGRLSGAVRGGSFTIRAPQARLILEAVETRLSIDGLRQLQLGGQALEVDGRGLVAVQRLELSDSSAELDLAELIHDPSFVIAGRSRVFFHLAAPCVVKIGSRAETPARVTGCDLRTFDQTASSPKDLERYGRSLRRLTLMLSGEPEVEVEGR